MEFILNKNFLNWKCTCRLNQKKYCKHAVAVGLEITWRK
ncbi:MAG: SWIM zinc finger family protein [Ignavibacteriae bacterium]|nr:SWIM zinc finger family protein [Ignavibacteriota bacterium]